MTRRDVTVTLAAAELPGDMTRFHDDIDEECSSRTWEHIIQCRHISSLFDMRGDAYYTPESVTYDYDNNHFYFTNVQHLYSPLLAETPRNK